MSSKANQKDAGSMSKKIADLIPTPEQDENIVQRLMQSNNSDTSQVDMGDDLLSLNWEIVFSGMLSDIVQVFDAYHHVNETVERFTFSMIASNDPEDLERQVQILSDLLRKLSARVNILCENNIRSIESQLEIVKVKSGYKKNKDEDDYGLGLL
ncbi:MAG: hypothetical protein K2M91_00760 [Lachnospiraceae bacterium]|nr:hypothetical protein [Lachnospiraceae bacterium]